MELRWKHRNYIAVFGRYFTKKRTWKATLTILLFTLAQHVSHMSFIPTEGYASKLSNPKGKMERNQHLKSGQVTVETLPQVMNKVRGDHQTSCNCEEEQSKI